MDEARPQQTKPRFYDLCKRYLFDALLLQNIGDKAGVSHSVVNAMFVGDPVERDDALKVLALVSEQTGQTWNLDNTNVPLSAELEGHQPKSPRLFFPDLWRIHRFRVDMIASLAKVSEEVISAMLRNDPVSKADAENVLATLSRVVKQEYTLATVHVALLEEDRP